MDLQPRLRSKDWRQVARNDSDEIGAGYDAEEAEKVRKRQHDLATHVRIVERKFNHLVTSSLGSNGYMWGAFKPLERHHVAFQEAIPFLCYAHESSVKEQALLDDVCLLDVWKVSDGEVNDARFQPLLELFYDW